MGTGNTVGAKVAHWQLGGSLCAPAIHRRIFPLEVFRGDVSQGGSATAFILDTSFCQWPHDPSAFLTLEERLMWKKSCA